MKARKLLAGLAVITSFSIPAQAQEALVTYKSLSPELALSLARAALGGCKGVAIK
jgi:hypothetical protein